MKTYWILAQGKFSKCDGTVAKPHTNYPSSKHFSWRILILTPSLWIKNIISAYPVLYWRILQIFCLPWVEDSTILVDQENKPLKISQDYLRLFGPDYGSSVRSHDDGEIIFTQEKFPLTRLPELWLPTKRHTHFAVGQKTRQRRVRPISA